MKNPPWHRDELILALDLYFRHNPSNISKSHPEVIKLSKILNDLPIHPKRADEARFRNPNGVYMKLCNFLRYDPNYSGIGLQRGGKLEKHIWDEFASDSQTLHKIAQGIIKSIDKVSKEPSLADEEEDAFPEGKVLYRRHKSLERNKRLAAKAKEIATRKGKLQCEACGFDFYKTYGELGQGYIECHHTVPISEYSGIRTTKVQDIALVCSNCHRMLHRKRPWLTVDKLADIVNEGE